MENIHENMHVFVSVKHESIKTCMFPCKFPFSASFYPITSFYLT